MDTPLFADFVRLFDSSKDGFAGLDEDQRLSFLRDFHSHLSPFAPPVLENKTHSELLEIIVSLHALITLLARIVVYTPGFPLITFYFRLAHTSPFSTCFHTLTRI